MDSWMNQYQHFTLRDQIELNRNIIDEYQITCKWVDQRGVCNELVKGKDLKSHLNLWHAVSSDLELYRCLWLDSNCSPDTMTKASLIRHVREQHLPVRWACMHCPQTFTREDTMMKHILRSSDHPFPDFE